MASGVHSLVRRQVSEPEVGLNKQKQQPRRHRLHAPRGQKNRTSLNKLRIWHVIYDYRTHQRIDSEIHRGHYLHSRSMRIKTRSDLQRLEYTVIIVTSTSSHPARRWWRRGGIDPSEHGSSGVDSPCGLIISDTAPRGPSLSGNSRYAPESSVDHALGAHRSCRPARGLAMGRSHALPRGTVIL